MKVCSLNMCIKDLLFSNFILLPMLVFKKGEQGCTERKNDSTFSPFIDFVTPEIPLKAFAGDELLLLSL